MRVVVWSTGGVGSNAIDAINDSGTHERLINIEATNLDDDHIEVIVRDSGPGFPQDFNLRQPGIHSSSKKDGLGVGLSLSRTIIEGHDGNLLLEGDGKGAVVHIRLKSFPRGMKE